jgi:hypothetical protein
MGAIERTPIAKTSQGEYDTSRVALRERKKRESQRPDRGSNRCKQSFDPKSEIDSKVSMIHHATLHEALRGFTVLRLA